ncbi:MAG: ABC transporter permease [Bdellovibrionales bacterium]|nr:ABC transporter permease [Bdellovibrionales bacterium]
MTRLWSTALVTTALASRNILRNPRRTLLTLTAVIVGVASTVALAALARGVAQQLVDDSIYNLTGHLKIQHPDSARDPAVEHTIDAREESVEALQQIPGVHAVLPRIVAPAVIRSERESFPITLFGVDPGLEGRNSVAGKAVSNGENLSDSDDSHLILGSKIVEKLETRIGRRVVVMTQDIENEIADRGFRIEGIFQAEVQSTELLFSFTGLETLRKMLRLKDDQLHEISILVEPEASLPEIQKQVQKLFPKAAVLTWQELQPLVVSMTKIQNGFLIIWFLIVIVSAGFGLVNSLLMSIFERVREIAVMHALGMTRVWIVIETVLQSFLLLVVGGLIGVLGGMAIVRQFSGGIDLSKFARGASIAGIGDRIVPQLIWSDVVLVVGLLIALGTLGSLYPAWLAAQVNPARSLQRL